MGTWHDGAKATFSKPPLVFVDGVWEWRDYESLRKELLRKMSWAVGTTLAVPYASENSAIRGAVEEGLEVILARVSPSVLVDSVRQVSR